MRTTQSMALGWVLAALACSRPPARGASDAGASSRKPRIDITVLAAGDEAKGDVGRLAEAWRTTEGHCLDGACRTLAVSTGGHGAGGVAALGYAASVLGPLERLLRDAGAATPPHVAADLSLADAGVPGAVVVERAGLRFYVMGLAAPSGADGGVDVTGLVQTLWRDVVASFKVAPAAVVVSAACVDVLATILEGHARAFPFLVAVVGRACGPTPPPRHIYSTLLLATPDGLDGYARATLSFDEHTAALLRAEGSVVTFGVDAGAAR